MAGSLKGSLNIGRFFGIKVLLHYSWFIIFGLLVWSLALSYFPVQAKELSAMAYWGMSIVAALLIFLSVLLHELCHSITAKQFRIKVDSITLFFFGGVAQITEDNFSPRKEFWVALAGPLFSFSAALFFLLLYKIVPGLYANAIFGYVAKINAILGAFNLLPGFPLDGGRIFRAILWKRFDDLEKATYYAVESGKVVAIGMIFFGIAGIFMGGFGLWYIVLGAFLYMISKDSYKQTMIKSALGSLLVKNAMKRQFKSLPVGMPLKKFDYSYFVKYEQQTFPVAKGRKIIGIARQEHIEKAKLAKESLKISDVTIPLSKIRMLKPDESCYTAFWLMMMQGIDLLPVAEKGKVIGIVKGATLIEIAKMRFQQIQKKKGK